MLTCQTHLEPPHIEVLECYATTPMKPPPPALTNLPLSEWTNIFQAPQVVGTPRDITNMLTLPQSTGKVRAHNDEPPGICRHIPDSLNCDKQHKSVAMPPAWLKLVRTLLPSMSHPLPFHRMQLQMQKCKPSLNPTVHGTFSALPSKSSEAFFLPVLYSSAPKGPMAALDKLMAMDGSLAKLHQFGMHDKFSGEMHCIKHTTPTQSRPTVRNSAASILSSA